MLSPTSASSSSSCSSAGSPSGNPRRFSLIPLTPDCTEGRRISRGVLSPHEWSRHGNYRDSSRRTSEIVLSPYPDPSQDSNIAEEEKRWVLMEYGRGDDTASLQSLSDASLKRYLTRPTSSSFSTAQYTDEDFKDLDDLNILSIGEQDKLGRVCVSLSASRIPDTIDYNRFSTYMVYKLDAHCEADYSLVYFHYGYDYITKPSWRSIVDIYKMLDRKFKKNVKAMYIVHPSRKIKLVMRVLTSLTSTQSRKKIYYCNTLNDLGVHVILNRLDIPVEVREHDRKISPVLSSCQPEPSGCVFGGSLEAMGEECPSVITDCITVLKETKNIKEEGLFRRSGNVQQVKCIKEQYNTQCEVCLGECDVHTVASVLKTFLRDLQQPILSYGAYPTVSHWNDFNRESRNSICTKIMLSLPSQHYTALAQLMLFLDEVVYNSTDNKMTAQNLSIVWGPNLVWPKNDVRSLADVTHINSFCQYLIENAQFFFCNDNDLSLYCR